MRELGNRLELLLARTDAESRLAADPLSFARRYPEPADREVAALWAAQLAFGRVAAFWPVLEAIFARADAAGGPHAWVEGFDLHRDGHTLDALSYRWLRGPDLALLAATAGRALRREGSLAALFAAPGGGETVRDGLAAAVESLRADAAALTGNPWQDQRRAFKHLLPSPRSGAACKRWNLFLRWCCRPDDGVDLGLWTHVPTAALVIPLDTHVLRIARLVGLTARRDASWRTGEEITAALRTLDPEDPVRFDFALAHVGIAGLCRRGECGECALSAVCAAA